MNGINVWIAIRFRTISRCSAVSIAMNTIIPMSWLSTTRAFQVINT